MHITTKVQFGSSTEKHAVRTFLLSVVILVISWCALLLQTHLGESQKSILHLRGLNMKHKLPFFLCDLPYNDYRCLFLSNKLTSQNIVSLIFDF